MENVILYFFLFIFRETYREWPKTKVRNMYVHFTWVQVVFGQAWTFSVVDYSLLLSASFRVMGDQHRKDELFGPGK